MTSTTLAPAKQTLSLTAGRLPQWAPWGMLALSFLLVGLVFGVLNVGEPLADFNIAGTVFIGVVLYMVMIYTVSSIVEGRRKGADRFLTALVSSAFIVALLPLISLLWTVVVNGVARLDVEFFTYTMRNIVGEGGGAYHAIVGTLLITIAATVISVPIGLMTSIYLVEYGSGGRLGRGPQAATAPSPSRAA